MDEIECPQTEIGQLALCENIIFEMDTKVYGHGFTEHDVQMLDLDKFM